MTYKINCQFCNSERIKFTERTEEGRIFHGTNRGSGKWRAEEIDAKAFARWLANAGK